MRIWPLLVMLCASIVTTNASRSQTLFMGAGASTCAEFAKLYQRNPGEYEYVYFHWAQGFMSAFNELASKESRRNLDGMNASEEMRYLRNYCSEHPLDEYYKAVVHLYAGLPRFYPTSANQK